MNKYLAILALYSLVLVALGLAVSRRVKKSSDFFVAGRSLGSGLIFSTFLAANIGAGSTVGATGLAYHVGASAWWWVGSAAVGCLVLAFTVGPRIWELATRNNFYTVGDFLEWRYSRRVRIAVALLLWAGALSILAGQLIAIAWILNVVAGLSKTVGCLLGGAIAITYFTAGGLTSAAWVNVLQLCVKMSGFMLAAPLALSAAGGLPSVEAGLARHLPPSFFDYAGAGLRGVAGYLLLLAPSFIVSPGLLQKLYGARDRKAVTWGVALNGLAMVAFAFVPVMLGMVAAAKFPGLQNRELALPMVMTQVLPFWVGAWALAAVFSAELSASDAILFMLSTSLVKDLYQGLLRPDASDRQLLRLSRLSALGAGAAGVALAVSLPSIISALSIFYTLVSVALFVPVLVGLYSSRPGSRAAMAAILTSVAATALLQFYTQGRGIYGLPPVAFGIATSAGVMALWNATGQRRREGN
ncbi:MAG: sodium:solute symporter family protein [Acidobacteria bacterium]|nr:sodium:solute symporter family protein [Acidobacteriota bacterium]